MGTHQKDSQMSKFMLVATSMRLQMLRLETFELVFCQTQNLHQSIIFALLTQSLQSEQS